MEGISTTRIVKTSGGAFIRQQSRVRELLQNSIDACHERMIHDNEKGKIEIMIDTKNKEFIITDNGIGMSEDVLINYYLVAGSSYRNSDQ